MEPDLSSTARSGKAGSYDESFLLGSAGQRREKKSLPVVLKWVGSMNKVQSDAANLLGP